MKIGELEVVRESRQVLRGGVAVRLGSRAFDLLQLLLDANGALIPTEEILAKVWPSTVVGENNIQVHICSLRQLLGENRHLIQNVSGRGYRMARPRITASAAASANDFPQTAPRLSRDFALPHASGPLFGREDCVQRLTSAIVAGEDTVITLAGPSGVGKSRLALEVARPFADRGDCQVAYLSFASHASHADVYDLIGAALEQGAGVAASGHAFPHARPGALLVLDNCDRVAEAVIQALADSASFRQASRTVVLLTTRSPLRVSMEKVVNIPSLLAVSPRGTLSAALELFLSRVRTFDPRIETGGAFLASAAHLVEQMDGLPLAIELAAYHTSMLGIESVLLLLKQNVDLCGSDVRRTSDSRHASLGAALLWTWPRLGARPQTLLEGLLDAGAEADLDRLRSIAEHAGLHREAALQAISDLAESSFIVRAYAGASVSYRIPNTVQRFLRQQRQAKARPMKPSPAGMHAPLRVRSSHA